MIRVGVNLLWLVPGEVGGSEEYTVRLLRALADLAPADLEVELLVNRRFAQTHPELTGAFSTRVAPIDGSSRPLRVLVESSWLARQVRRDRLEVVHHAGGTMPVIRTRPGIVTLHDLQPITHPERFGLVKRTYIRTIAPRSLRSAVGVVCLTPFTAGDAVALAGVDPTLVSLDPCGIDPAGPGPDAAAVDRVLDRLGLAELPFVLYPAITYPHKNHLTLLAAFARLTADRPDLRLVLTGGSGPSESSVLDDIASRGLTASVIRTGRIAEAELDALYRRATVLAFPSAYEGFGLPVLEAMSRGCAVVSSTAGGLPSVVGDAAVLVEPDDVAGWAAALAEVIDDGGHRASLVARGLEQSGHHRWPDSAAALAEVYRRAATPLAPTP